MTERYDRDAEPLSSSPRGETCNVRVAGFDEIRREPDERVAPARDAERESIAADEWNGRPSAREDVREPGKRSRHEQRVPDGRGELAEPCVLCQQVLFYAAAAQTKEHRRVEKVHLASSLPNGRRRAKSHDEGSESAKRPCWRRSIRTSESEKPSSS